jgi:hypothetical protein
VLPGIALTAVGLDALSVAVTIAANAGVRPDKAGRAAALLNTSQQIGGALGLAIFAAIATSRLNRRSTTHLIWSHGTCSPAVSDPHATLRMSSRRLDLEQTMEIWGAIRARRNVYAYTTRAIAPE